MGSLLHNFPTFNKDVIMIVKQREDIAELANVLAWDAVGAQIEPYLVQHA